MKATPYSSLKVFAHLDKIDQVIKENKRLAPVYIRIKPTNYCNQNCYYCSYADQELGLRDSVRNQDQIPWDKMQEIIQDISKMGVKAVTFSGGGEPLVYPYIVEAMNQLLHAGIDLSIITNGQLLNKERAKVLSNAKWVRISFDSAKAETYAKIRRVPIQAFYEVCNNIKQFSQLKADTCELGINFVVNHENAEQIYEMAKLAKSLGVNHVKYTARITKDLFEYHKPFKDAAIHQIHQAQKEFESPGFKIINKYEGDFESAMVFHRCYGKCYINHIFTVIAADSKVYFCHDKAYVSSGVVGDLKEQSFYHLWYSQAVKERYEQFDPYIECNHHCVYDDRNDLLNTFYSLDQNHINFI